MVNFFEIVRRAIEGPYYTEKDFDMKVLVPKVFQAGLELHSAVGTYCTDTSRVIQLTEEEILQGLRDAPAAPVFGEGSDRKTLVGRRPESDSPPWCFLGAGGATCSNEDVYVRLVEGYGRNPLADSITCPNLATIGGL